MTSLNLLHKVIELLAYNKSDEDFYSPENLKDNPPKYYRLLQIEALLEALNITQKDIKPSLLEKGFSLISKKKHKPQPSPLSSFIKGEFLFDREESPAITDLIKRIKNNAGKVSKGLSEKEVTLPWLFNDLLNYRIDIERFAQKPQGFIEGFNIALYYGHRFQAEIAETLQTKITEIDNLLALLIDPLNQDINIEILIKDYNYPDVDLKELDLAWIVKNY